MKGQFTLEDFLEQLREMRKLGPIQDLLKMLPGVPGGKAADEGARRGRGRGGAQPRRGHHPVHDAPGAAGIPLSSPGLAACGSRTVPATTTADVNTLLKDFEGARKMMRTMMGGKRVPGMKMPTKLPTR